jgi:RNA polymerase sigma factor (sigma-70 family)
MRWWQWVFDGIGAALLVAIGGTAVRAVLRWRRGFSAPGTVNQRARASSGSNVIQVGGDFKIEITPEIAKLIADELAKRFIHGPSPLALPSARQLPKILARAITELPDESRVIVALRYVEGLSVAEIATVLGVDSATAQRLLDESLRILAGPVLDSW